MAITDDRSDRTKVLVATKEPAAWWREDREAGPHLRSPTQAASRCSSGMVCFGVRIETLSPGITLSTANIPRELAQRFNVDLSKADARVDIHEEGGYPELGTSPVRPIAHIGRQVIVHPRQRAIAHEGDDIGQLERVALVGRIGWAEPNERQLRQPDEGPDEGVGVCLPGRRPGKVELGRQLAEPVTMARASSTRVPFRRCSLKPSGTTCAVKGLRTPSTSIRSSGLDGLGEI